MIIKDKYHFTACIYVTNILHNNDVITSIVKLFVHNSVGKLIQLTIIIISVCVCVCACVRACVRA